MMSPTVSTTDLNYTIIMLLILGGAFLYQRYIDYHAIVNHPHYDGPASAKKLPRTWNYSDVMLDSDEQIRQHLDNVRRGNGPDLNKPLLWIHVEREWNARRWSHFFERGSNDINQPYLYLTIKSIADQCGDDFNIVILDDDSFANLLPNWNVDMERVGDPVKSHMRRLALAQLLHQYGGLTLPPSTICVHNLLEMHRHGISKGRTMYMGQFANTSHYRFPETRMDGDQNFKVEPAIMGCAPKSPAMLRLVKFLEMQQASDHSNETDFKDSCSAFCTEMFHSGLMHVIDGRMIGTRTANNKVVTIHELMGSSYVKFDTPSLYCIHVPHKELLAMPKHSWFAYVSVADVLRSETIIGNWLALGLGGYRHWGATAPQ